MGFLFGSCCGKPPRYDRDTVGHHQKGEDGYSATVDMNGLDAAYKKQQQRRRRRFRRRKTGSGLGGSTMSSVYGSPRSALSEDEEYFDADDSVMSLGSSAVSERELRRRDVSGIRHETLLDRLAAWWHSIKESEDEEMMLEEGETGSGEGNWNGDVGRPQRYHHLKKSVSIVEDDAPVTPGCVGLLTAAQAIKVHKKFEKMPSAGKSLSRSNSLDHVGESYAWDVPDPQTFMVRSKTYMKTKIKVPSETSIYTLVGSDIYSFDRKMYHVAQHVVLPEVPELGAKTMALPPEERLPPILIINLQLPTYPPVLFGQHDGPGYSLIYYFTLPEGWEPDDVGNDAALAMALRLVNNGLEADGQPTRDRLKLLPRIVNVDEWGKNAPLSGPEIRLIRNYNGKPLLMRPQQSFILDSQRRYFEIDVDVHRYAYIARRAFYGYIPRLASAIFENGFVIQGNDESELPEVLLAAARVCRIDFTKAMPYPAV